MLGIPHQPRFGAFIRLAIQNRPLIDPGSKEDRFLQNATQALTAKLESQRVPTEIHRKNTRITVRTRSDVGYDPTIRLEFGPQIDVDVLPPRGLFPYRRQPAGFTISRDEDGRVGINPGHGTGETCISALEDLKNAGVKVTEQDITYATQQDESPQRQGQAKFPDYLNN